MERELWSQISAAIFDVQRTHRSGARFQHDTACIVRVFLWAVLHDRSVNWACHAENWDRRKRPEQLPSQSTMSRRLRRHAVWEFLEAVGCRLRGRPAERVIKCIDAKPLQISEHTRDPDAKSGRTAGGFGKGYKLYTLWADEPMPMAWEVHPMSKSEITVAKRLLPMLTGRGYVLGDKLYDCNELYDIAASRQHQLLAARCRPNTPISQRNLSPHRAEGVKLLAADSGQQLYEQRSDIERRYGNLTSFGGGLNGLPAWVRRIHRVRLWVHAKLLVNAARIRVRA